MAKKKKFYAVVHGRAPGIYQDWAGETGAQAQVKGYPGALYRGFAAYQDAAAWFEEQSGGVRPRLIGANAGVQTAIFENAGEYNAEPESGRIVIYTDGSSLTNPGPGGYGAVLLYPDRRKELSGGYRLTTNNRMELMACIMALRSLESDEPVELYCDSRYVVDSISKGWAKRWKSKRWKRDRDQPVENADLWAQLLELLDSHKVDFHWLAGHAGHKENERCDQLARKAARGKYLPVDVGYQR
jgi:ribonuclease HI